jgi:hypothetical protein
MQRMTFHVADDIARAVRQDAQRKGQSLSVWFLRAAIAALQPEASEDASVRRRYAGDAKSREPVGGEG